MSRLSPALVQVQGLLEQGRVEEACAACQRAVQRDPRDARGAMMLANIMLRLARAPQAAHFAQRAADLAGPDLALRVEAAHVLRASGESPKAVRVLEGVLRADPRHMGARSSIATLLLEDRRFVAAERLIRETLAMNPADGTMRSRLAAAMLSTGRPAEAFELMREVAREAPEYAALLSGLAIVSNYVPDLPPGEVAAVHRMYGDLIARQHPVPRGPYPNPRDADRALRVGLISPDLREHSVARFVEPLLRWHDRARIETYVYYTNIITDAVTARLRPLATAWRDLPRAPDEQVAQLVFDDRIDVLVELSGHTHSHSLLAMHLRPAPVQATFIGYPNTTGLSAIDYRIVDSTTDPRGASDGLASEKLWRLDPCFLCYQTPERSPDVRPRREGGIVFGSFNSAQKLNERVIALWGRVLAAAPGSRLLLKAVNFVEPELRDAIRGRFTAAGFDGARVEIAPPTDGVEDHLAAYAGVDIGLDPMPYNGTTTTCEALWMGVPVVTLAGRMHAGRVGASLLAGVGLPELVAGDEDEYVSIAAGLAKDGARLAGLRAGLRERMRGSVLCDGPAYCRRFEGAVREMFREWAAKNPG